MIHRGEEAAPDFGACGVRFGRADQARGGVAEQPVRTLHATAPELFTQPAIHTLAVKLSYWFG